MDREWTMLPDGSVFYIDSPDDWLVAAQIARDELGNDIVVGASDD